MLEDDYNPSGTVTQINRYALGARGIDRIARTESGNTTLAYPMYDGHGNMRALLTRDGTGYDTGNWKTYDVWGSVRSGGSSADPKQGYVASIGHVSDGESSLIYMRARCYEPATGRFVSEDPAMDGANWYVYCRSNPTNLTDPTGRAAVLLVFGLGALASILATAGYLAGTNLAMMIVTDELAKNRYGREVSEVVLASVIAAHSQLHQILVGGLIAGAANAALFAMGAVATGPIGLTLGAAFGIAFLMGFMDVLWNALIHEAFLMEAGVRWER